MPTSLMFVIWLAGSTFAAADAVEMKAVQIAPHTYYVQGETGVPSGANEGYMSNAGFVVTDDGVVVFDALGTPALGQQMIQTIRSVTDRPIRRVIVSHYHADHFYGLQAFKVVGAEIWAHRSGKGYLASDIAQQRLERRREELFPWVDENTRLVPADRWLEGSERFELGSVRFTLEHIGPAHSPEDLIMMVEEDGVMFVGDLIFAGRVPFVGDADSKQWLAAIDAMLTMKPRTLVPGHGPASTNATQDLRLTQEYLTYLRKVTGAAVANLDSFDEVYAKTDWSRFQNLPAFAQANRVNAYNIYIQMEREALQK